MLNNSLFKADLSISLHLNDFHPPLCRYGGMNVSFEKEVSKTRSGCKAPKTLKAIAPFNKEFSGAKRIKVSLLTFFTKESK